MSDQEASSREGSSTRTPQTSSLLGLFEPPTGEEANNEDTDAEESTTTPQVPSPRPILVPEGASNLMGMFQPQQLAVTERTGDVTSEQTALLQGYKATAEEPAVTTVPATPTIMTKFQHFCRRHFQPTTFAGALMFLLYHVVFCLANGSAITRPKSSRPILGVMAKMSAVGILFAGPFYIHRLGDDIPAIYPSIDLFLAPFLAGAAIDIDNALDDGNGNDDAVFFASFAVLVAIGMFLSGVLLLSAATFKLANLGTFLPYSVLCGFFSAVGVLLWALAFSVDTNGKTWQTVFFSRDGELIKTSLIHHIPSLAVGILMNLLGPKNPFYVVLLILGTLVMFYIVMGVTGTTLQEAQQAGWFWSQDDLAYEREPGFSWAPPAPFSIFKVLFDGTVNWTAVSKGLGGMVALSVLYLLRSSIHSSAMKKNVGNLVRKERIPPFQFITEHGNGEAGDDITLGDVTYSSMAGTPFSNRFSESIRLVSQTLESSRNQVIHRTKTMKRPVLQRDVSERVDLPVELMGGEMDEETEATLAYREIRAKIPKRSLEDIFVQYGYALLIVFVTGGFGVCPTVATSNTMYAIGADGSAPQYGSILLLIFFYLTDFEMVRFIPKAAFSSLLVLGAVDTFVVWFFLAYRKTQDILEWLIVPVIVAFSLIVGFLNAVFLGIGIAMFVFVANSFRVGVVKYYSSGLELHSTIERTPAAAEWLDLHGDYIQILVLQNYLFFGNANSVLNYISTMFEEIDENEPAEFDPPPFPKVVIVDLSLTSGMDTSSYDIFAEIHESLKSRDCKLYLCGLSHRVRAGLGLVGVKPSTGRRSDRLVRFFPDLDAALGKAEDVLTADLDDFRKGPVGKDLPNNVEDVSETGFQRALRQIDEQHDIDMATGLVELEKYTVQIDLEPGQQLYGDGVEDYKRGLFFIESGILKIQRDTAATLTRNRSSLTQSKSMLTLNKLHARTGSIGRRMSALKLGALLSNPRALTEQNFRLARIGPGWLVGGIELSSGGGLRDPGVHLAVCRCRLHHLPFDKVQRVEQETPELAVKLYKLIAHLMAHRQEVTIAQLATLKSIMSAPAHSAKG